MEDNSPAPIDSHEPPQTIYSSSSKTNRARVWFALVIALVILLGVSLGIYWFVRHVHSSKPTQTQQQAVDPDASLPPAQRATLTTLANGLATLEPPMAADLAPYNAVISAESSGYYQYNTQDQQCSFGFGVRSAQEQGGNSFHQMVSLLVNNFESKGMKVESQTLGDPLILTASTDTAVRYTFPTAVIVVKRGTEAALQYFSAAILQNGDRVSITRTCQFVSGNIDQAAMTPIEATMRKITVQLQAR